MPVYSEQEYQVHLHDDGWTKAETDHLFDLCKRFDLRFVVVHDRYDHQQYRVITLSLFQWFFLFCFVFFPNKLCPCIKILLLSYSETIC